MSPPIRQRPEWADELLDLAVQEATGRLVVASPAGEFGWVWLRDGQLSGASAATRRPLLSRRLIAFEILTEAFVDEALESIRLQPGQRLLDIVIQERLAPAPFIDMYLRHVMAEQLGFMMASDVSEISFEAGRVQRVSPLLLPVSEVLMASLTTPFRIPDDIADQAMRASVTDFTDSFAIQRSVLSASNGRRTPEQVADHCGLTTSEILQIIADLERRGTLQLSINDGAWRHEIGVIATADDAHMLTAGTDKSGVHRLVLEAGHASPAPRTAQAHLQTPVAPPAPARPFSPAPPAAPPNGAPPPVGQRPAAGPPTWPAPAPVPAPAARAPQAAPPHAAGAPGPGRPRNGVPVPPPAAAALSPHAHMAPPTGPMAPPPQPTSASPRVPAAPVPAPTMAAPEAPAKIDGTPPRSQSAAPPAANSPTSPATDPAPLTAAPPAAPRPAPPAAARVMAPNGAAVPVGMQPPRAQTGAATEPEPALPSTQTPPAPDATAREKQPPKPAKAGADGADNHEDPKSSPEAEGTDREASGSGDERAAPGRPSPAADDAGGGTSGVKAGEPCKADAPVARAAGPRDPARPPKPAPQAEPVSDLSPAKPAIGPADAAAAQEQSPGPSAAAPAVAEAERASAQQARETVPSQPQEPADPADEAVVEIVAEHEPEALAVLAAISEAAEAAPEPAVEPQAEVTTTSRGPVWQGRPRKPSNPMQTSDVFRELQSLGIEDEAPQPAPPSRKPHHDGKDAKKRRLFGR